MNLKRLVYDIRVYFIVICSISAKQYDNSLRVIGGRDATPGEFPYVLKMEIKIEGEQGVLQYLHLCTCSLLKPTWSLTAGHCISALLSAMSHSPSVKGIIKYNISFHHESPYSSILSTVVHPNMYLSDTAIRNDVGLLKSEEVHIANFVKLSSIDYLSLGGNKVSSLGFGITKGASGVFNDAYSVNKSLQVLDIIITKCTFNDYPVYPVLCSGGICGKWSTICPGDSGGPLLHASGLVGINTAIDFWSCNEKLSLVVKLKASSGKHTAVSPFIDWILKIIK